MIQETIRSCWAQTVLPDEIVIGDDSEDDRTAILIGKLREGSPVPMVYRRHAPPLGQSRNVQDIFEAAASTWLLLIHDDDWLLPEAVAALTAPLRQGEQADVLFGKQLRASDDGVVDEAGGESFNRLFHRSSETAGPQRDSLRSAVLGQFPNNGYLVRRSLAVEVGYHRDHLRDGCDYAFGLHLAAAGARFWFVNAFTAVYRHSELSILRNALGSTCDIDMATAVRPYLGGLDPHDPVMRNKIRADLYRAAVWCGLKRTRRMQVLHWALDSRWGLPWWPEGLSALAALLAPRARTRVKPFLGLPKDVLS